MVTKLNESPVKSYWKYNQFEDTLDETKYYDKYSIKRIKLIPCSSADECYDDMGRNFSAWAVTEPEYPYKEVYCTKEKAYDYLMQSLNNGRYETIHDL